MQCPSNEVDKSRMLSEINDLGNNENITLMKKPHEVFYSLMGKHPADVSCEAMSIIWQLSAKYVTRIYKEVISDR